MFHARLRPLPHQASSEQDNKQELDEESESIFEAFLPQLFPDDTPQFYGDPGQHLLYSSPHYGDLNIMVPAYPGESDSSETNEQGLGKDVRTGSISHERSLFAHLLWSSGLVVADELENASALPTDTETTEDRRSRELWSIKGHKVLELGAGAAIPSLFCALGNASSVVATDHPSSPALVGAIEWNMKSNLCNHSSTTDISIKAHEWGVLNTPFAQEQKGSFTRIIAADCLWMEGQHENLVRTMKWFLAPEGKIWVLAGLHTGRPIVANFFETALNSGLILEQIFERDLISTTEDGKQIRREWSPVREGEGISSRPRWIIIAILKHKFK